MLTGAGSDAKCDGGRFSVSVWVFVVVLGTVAGGGDGV